MLYRNVIRAEFSFILCHTLCDLMITTSSFSASLKEKRYISLLELHEITNTVNGIVKRTHSW